jgi:TRAP-type uncharacterized transport system fused permease subunit
MGRRNMMSEIDPGRERRHVRQTSTFAAVICLLSCIIKIISAILGKTTIQTLDAFRSTVETSVVLIWWVFCISKRFEFSSERQNMLNRIIRAGMIISALLMLAFAVFRFFTDEGKSGVLWIGFLVSLIGANNNLIVAVRYRKKADKMEAIRVQSRLFFVKSAADACVCITLLIMMLSPRWEYTRILQLISSIILSAAMAIAGVMRDKEPGMN